MKKPMNYGITVSKAGYSVTDPDAPAGEQSKKLTENTIKEMVSALSLAFILGAKEQIVRYKEAYEKLEANPGAGVMRCLHEALTLLEDLDTLYSYTGKCGETHDLNKTIRNMRNHARHDIRDHINNENDRRRIKRGEELRLHQNLLVNIGFSEDAIKMGSTVLTLEEASQYIEWATNILTEVIANGIKAGRIKGMEVAE